MPTSPSDNLIVAHTKHNVNSLNSDTIKTYPELNAVALAQHLDTEIMTYYICRMLDLKHSGFVPYEQVKEYILTIPDFGESKFFKALKDGNCTFFEKVVSNKNIKYIKICSIEKVATKLEITHLSNPVMIDLKNCNGLLKTRQELYSTLFKNDEGQIEKPKSRETIERETGISRQQQQRYGKSDKMETKPNFATEKTIYEGKNKEYFCQRQLGNSYTSKNPKAPIGMVRKINRKLEANLSCSGDAKDVQQMRYFLKPELNKGIFGERFLIDKETKDYNLWVRF